jgi:hypothetical protein
MAILPRRMPHQRRRAPALAPLLVLAFMLALSAGSVHAAQQVEREREETQGYRFQILTGDDSAVTHRIADDLYKRLVPTFAAFRTELAQKRRMLYIAIGPTALRDALSRRCDCVVISAYTSSQVWRTVTSRPSQSKTRRPVATAIYAEPAPRDQMRLAALLYGRPVRVGVG